MAEANSTKLDFENYLIDEWTFEVEGEKFSVEKGGTEVPKSKVEAIKKEARLKGLTLREV